MAQAVLWVLELPNRAVNTVGYKQKTQEQTRAKMRYLAKHSHFGVTFLLALKFEGQIP